MDDQALESRFNQLLAEMPDTPQKQALSILHALQAKRQSEPEPGDWLEAVLDRYRATPRVQEQALNRGLPVGALAPNFRLPDANGDPVELADYRGWSVVLVFYPLDWEPVSGDQLRQYQRELDRLEHYQTYLIAVSVDSLYSHGAWAAVNKLTFPLLADFNPKGEVAARYEVMREPDGISERALFLIDQAGLVRYRHISAWLHELPDIDELFVQIEWVRRLAQDTSG